MLYGFPHEIAERRALVESRMLRVGVNCNRSQLARELGVSRWTIQRDIKAVKARWAALSGLTLADLYAERARAASALEGIARTARSQYVRYMVIAPEWPATQAYLRTAMQAIEKRARLLGLDRLGPVDEPLVTSRQQAALEHWEPEIKFLEGQVNGHGTDGGNGSNGHRG